ncbi:MAG: hypothetical protein MI922_20330 [Bacteroidales bacterium]|nr:hypothetical protein [Bacteroidales bacterium]
MKKISNWCILLIGLLLTNCRPASNDLHMPLSIKSMEQIGELVSAEYYGEVLESLRKIKTEDANFDYETTYRAVYDSVSKNLKPADKKKYLKKIRASRNFIKNNPELADHIVFKRLMKIAGRTSNVNFIYYDVINYDWNEFKTEHQSRFDKILQRQTTDANVVYIGRGWVKAGFDLKNYDWGTNDTLIGTTLYLRDLDPKILDADINPWFVPNSVKGFEIIDIDKARQVSLSDITLVKTRCKEKLQKQAFERRIMDMAIESAEESLLGFLGLFNLENNMVVEKIVIQPTEMFDVKNQVITDGIIDDMEIEQLQEYKAMLDSIQPVDEAKYENFYHSINDIYLATIASPQNSRQWKATYKELRKK